MASPLPQRIHSLLGELEVDQLSPAECEGGGCEIDTKCSDQIFTGKLLVPNGGSPESCGKVVFEISLKRLYRLLLKTP